MSCESGTLLKLIIVASKNSGQHFFYLLVLVFDVHHAYRTILIIFSVRISGWIKVQGGREGRPNVITQVKKIRCYKKNCFLFCLFPMYKWYLDYMIWRRLIFWFQTHPYTYMYFFHLPLSSYFTSRLKEVYTNLSSRTKNKIICHSKKLTHHTK